MQISRRDFLKYAGASAAALCLSRLELDRVEEVFASSDSPPVIWLVGSGCSGCSVSLMNAVSPTIDDVLLNTISLKYHPTLMTAVGDLAVSAATSAEAEGNYILVVEGGVPTGDAGKFCTVWDEGAVPVTMASAVPAGRGIARRAVVRPLPGLRSALGRVYPDLTHTIPLLQ